MLNLMVQFTPASDLCVVLHLLIFLKILLFLSLKLRTDFVWERICGSCLVLHLCFSMYEPFRYMEEGHCRGKRTVTQEDEAEVTLSEFRKPRNAVLCIVARFYSHSTGRIRELRKILADPTFKMPELLDSKAHNVSYRVIVSNCSIPKRTTWVIE